MRTEFLSNFTNPVWENTALLEKRWEEKLGGKKQNKTKPSHQNKLGSDGPGSGHTWNHEGGLAVPAASIWPNKRIFVQTTDKGFPPRAAMLPRESNRRGQWVTVGYYVYYMPVTFCSADIPADVRCSCYKQNSSIVLNSQVANQLFLLLKVS